MLSRDPACRGYSVPLLYFKGFHALQSYRVAHYYWTHERPALALYLQSRISEAFAVDIHPGARIGKGIMFDHATSVVIGGTAVIEDDFSMLHEVTLGGTGKVGGDRHPKIGKGVMITSSRDPEAAVPHPCEAPDEVTALGPGHLNPQPETLKGHLNPTTAQTP